MGFDYKSRLFVACAALCACCAAAPVPPPPTRVDNVTETIHGVRITDPYRWLEDQNSPATRAWIESQSKFARAYLDALPGRAELREKLAGMLKIDIIGRPIMRHDRYFFTRRLAQESRASICMRQGFAGQDQVLVDPNRVSPEPNTSVLLLDVSEDANLLAYGVRHGGEDESDIRILDLRTRALRPDGLPKGRYMGFSIRPDNSGIYYSRFAAGQGSRVYYHAMGSAAGADREIFGQGSDANHLIFAGLSEDGRYLIIDDQLGVPARKTAIYVQDVAHDGPIRPIVNDIDAEFRPAIVDDRLYLWTNWNAPNWRILMADLKNPAPANWKEVVPEAAQVIDGLDLSGKRLFVAYLENVSTRIKQFDPDGKYLGDVKLPGIGTAGGPAGRWNRDEAFLSFTSFTEPAAIWRYTISTGKQDLWFRPKIPVRSEDFEVEQVWYESKDKTKVPMFLVHRKGVERDGKCPTLLYGYGGFTASLTPQFSPVAAAWVGMGGVYAVANLRGGGEFGERWHRAGMFEKKQNVFDDFIAAAEWLIANRYTSPAHLAIRGGSNGGLLVGAVMTQRPDLYAAVLCDVPLLDMLRYHKFKVGSWWAAEYGSADDPKQFPYLYKYSPYHHVAKGVKYPAVLFVSGDSDSRVDPLHARKMAALVQASTASDKPVLLRYDTSGGHSASGSIDKTIDELVDELSFAAAQVK